MQDEFETPDDLKMKLITSFPTHIPEVPDQLTVGYFEPKSSGKKWNIVSTDDLHRMYRVYERGSEIILWCDGKPADKSKKRVQSDDDNETAPVNKKARHEEQVEKLCVELGEKHGSRYSQPQYKLWSRMIKAGQWKSDENPPDIPMFTGPGAVRSARKDSTADILANAAVRILDHFQPKGANAESHATDMSSGLSPAKKASLRKQYLDQLQAIQKLFDDGTLTFEEFNEEKQRVLSTLRAMK